MLHEANLFEVESFIALAKDLDVNQINFLPLVPKGFGVQLRSQQEAHTEIHQKLSQIYKTGDSKTKALLSGSLPDIIARERVGKITAANECVAGYRGLFYVKPDGSVFSCPNLEDPAFAIGNVKESSLDQLHNRLGNFYQGLRSDQADDTFLCTGERKRYSADGDTTNLSNLQNLQDILRIENVTNEPASNEVAFCVSRNW